MLWASGLGKKGERCLHRSSSSVALRVLWVSLSCGFVKTPEICHRHWEVSVSCLVLNRFFFLVCFWTWFFFHFLQHETENTVIYIALILILHGLMACKRNLSGWCLLWGTFFQGSSFHWYWKISGRFFWSRENSASDKMLSYGLSVTAEVILLVGSDPYLGYKVMFLEAAAPHWLFEGVFFLIPWLTWWVWQAFGKGKDGNPNSPLGHCLA